MALIYFEINLVDNTEMFNFTLISNQLLNSQL